MHLTTESKINESKMERIGEIDNSTIVGYFNISLSMKDR